MVADRRAVLFGGAAAGAFGGLARRRADQQLVASDSLPPPASPNLIRAIQVVIFGANGGMFVYSGAPGLGNPPVEYVTAPGTTKDPYGNTLPASTGGFTSVRYSGGVAQALIELNSGLISLFAGPPSGYASGAGIAVSAADSRSLVINGAKISAFDVACEILLVTQQFGSSVPAYLQIANSGTLLVGTTTPPETTALAEIQGQAAVAGIDAIVSSATETWHTVTTGFPAGWGGKISYKKLAQTNVVMIDFQFTIANGTVVTANETIASGLLPAAYRPTVSKEGTGSIFPSGGASTQAGCRINTGGSFVWTSAAVTPGANQSWFGNMTFPTDI